MKRKKIQTMEDLFQFLQEMKLTVELLLREGLMTRREIESLFQRVSKLEQRKKNGKEKK